MKSFRFPDLLEIFSMIFRKINFAKIKARFLKKKSRFFFSNKNLKWKRGGFFGAVVLSRSAIFLEKYLDPKYFSFQSHPRRTLSENLNDVLKTQLVIKKKITKLFFFVESCQNQKSKVLEPNNSYRFFAPGFGGNKGKN